MLLHAQKVMPPNDYICDVLMVRTLALLGNSLYLLDANLSTTRLILSRQCQFHPF